MKPLTLQVRTFYSISNNLFLIKLGDRPLYKETETSSTLYTRKVDPTRRKRLNIHETSPLKEK